VGGRFITVDLMGDPSSDPSPNDTLTAHRNGAYELAFSFAYPGRRVSAGGYYRILSELTNWFQYGGSVAYALRDDISVGATLHVDQLATSDARGSTIEQLKPTLHLGLLYSPSSRVHVGLVHQPGVRHSMVDPILSGGISPEIVGTVEYELRLPDVTRVGVGFRVTESTTVVVEGSKTRYSQLAPAFAAQLLLTTSKPTDVVIDDSREVRVAVEQAVRLGTKTLALRGGAWREDPHQTTYVGPDPLLRTLFTPDARTRVHVTGGIGFSSERFGVGVGADVARDFRRLVATGAVRFR
jgi:hypothetical protein